MKLKFWLSTTVTLLSLPFAGAALADATLSDGTFNNVTSTANFSVAPAAVSLPGNALAAAEILIQLFRANYLTATPPGSMTVPSDAGLIDNLPTYNPSVQGAIAPISASAAK